MARSTRPTTAKRAERSRRSISPVLAAAAVLAVVALAVAAAAFQPWRLLTNTTVEEALPSAAPVAPAAPAADPSASGPPSTSSARASTPAAPPTPAAPRELLRGSFVSQAHDTSGSAVVLELADGSRVLRLEGLDTDDGPDLKVWLTDAPATADGGGAVDQGRYLALGDLKGNRGNQNYPIPAGADLSGLTTVSIWCDRFNVSFGAAALAGA